MLMTTSPFNASPETVPRSPHRHHPRATTSVEQVSPRIRRQDALDERHAPPEVLALRSGTGRSDATHGDGSRRHHQRGDLGIEDGSRSAQRLVHQYGTEGETDEEVGDYRAV